MDIDVFIYLDNLRTIAAGFPGVTEAPCFGTPAFYVQKKLLARFWEDGVTLAIRTAERDKWIEKNPEVFFLTDHYKNYPTMLIHLAKVKQADLKLLFMQAWQSRASKKLLQQFADLKISRRSRR